MACVCVWVDGCPNLISGGRGYIIPTILPYNTIHISALDQKSKSDQHLGAVSTTTHCECGRTSVGCPAAHWAIPSCLIIYDNVWPFVWFIVLMCRN